MELTWDDPDDDSITGYRILRRTTGEFSTIEANTASQDTSYTDSSVEAETNYAYQIKAINDDGESDPSNTHTVTTPEEPEAVQPDPPDAPTGLTASALQATTVTLDWDDTDDDRIDGYQILRRNRDGKEHGDGNGPAEFSLIVEDTESTDTSHRDSSAAEETRYEYQVKARWGSLLSHASNTVQVETPPLRKGRSTHNTDPSLSSITVDSTAVPGFAHDRTSYEYGVANTVTQVTIAATTTDADASWAVTSPVDADSAAGHQVNLTAGQNAVTIRGTSEDGNNTQDYTLNVNRGVDTDFGWKATDDLDGLIAAGHDNPIGLWSNGTTFWVVNDTSNDAILAYNADGTRDSTNDFNTLEAAGIANPRGIWSDDTTMWVAENSNTQDKLFAYRLSNKQRDATKDFDTLHAAGNNDPFGIWSDGTTMWVVDFDKTIYAYQMSDKQRDSSKEFTTLDAAENDNPFGIWSDGATMWVTDYIDDKLYAYKMYDKERDSSKDFNTLDPASNDRPYGLWSDGQTMWVVDNDEDKVFSYNKPASDVATLKSITVAPRDILRFDPDRFRYHVGVASDVTEATSMVETSHPAATWALGSPGQDKDTAPGIQLRDLKRGPNSAAITVTAEDGTTALTYTVSINRSTDATFGWNAVKDLENIEPSITSFAPTDITGKEGHFLVSAQNQRTLDAYLPDGTHDSTLSLDLDADNGRPLYLYTDDQHLWVSDETDAKLYVYDLQANRQSGMDFDFDSNNTAPKPESTETRCGGAGTGRQGGGDAIVWADFGWLGRWSAPGQPAAGRREASWRVQKQQGKLADPSGAS